MFSFSQSREDLQHLTDLPISCVLRKNRQQNRAAEISSDPLFLEVEGLTLINLNTLEIDK